MKFEIDDAIKHEDLAYETISGTITNLLIPPIDDNKFSADEARRMFKNTKKADFENFMSHDQL